ncbi:putative RNA-directed DNA polymerase [Tanacetum coccineum]
MLSDPVTERSGCRFDNGEANVFNEFISRVGFFDFPLGGRRFTSFRVFDKWIGKCRTLTPSSVLDSWNQARPFVLCSRPDNLSQNKLKRLRAENGLLSDVDIAKREEWLMDLGHIEQLRRDDIRQKSRIKWAVEGDENTHFFHSILTNNYANYSIKGINVNGAWIDSPDDIKQASLDHFSARFKEEFMTRPSFTSSRFRTLSLDAAQALESKFSMDEVKDAIWNCDGSKAPGPDGFNFNFIKSHWEVLKFDFWNCVKHFELGNGCNASFVVLIPKKNDPLGFSDYRPISLIGCVYKIISKLLASRLARVIDSVIGPNQSAFIEGRQILDGCLIANEVIRMVSLENQKLLLFKVDFEKAFHSVNWKFLLNVMRQMGFGLKWRKWIYSCLASASISIIINVSPTKEFKMERGLRQGDPLSPFFFLLVAEALQVTVLEACNVGLYNGVSLASNGANISLLQYANDALFFGEWSRWNAKNLIHILKCFELGSGLKVNLAKSRILGVGVPINVVQEVSASLGCAHDSLPFIYLGLPVGRKMRLCVGWDTVVNRVRNRLSSWKAKSLSIGGRLTLVKSVLGSIPIFYLSLFKSPVKIIDMLESLRCRFFWGFKEGQSGMYWVKWNSILLDSKSKKAWGWGVSIRLLIASRPVGFGLILLKLLRTLKLLMAPLIYPLCAKSWTEIALLKTVGSLKMEFGVEIRIDDFPLGVELSMRFLISSRKYNVKTLSSRIQLISLSDHIIGECHRRNSWIPRKVNIFVWRASLNRLPTRANLASRHITLASSNCPVNNKISLTKDDPEVGEDRNESGPLSHSVSSSHSYLEEDLDCMHMRKVLNGVFQIALWVIWNWRNRLVYASGDLIAKTIEEDVFPAIQRVSKTWIAACLSTAKSVNWNNWISKPFELVPASFGEFRFSGSAFFGVFGSVGLHFLGLVLVSRLVGPFGGSALVVFPKLLKARVKDPLKREMNMEEKHKLGLGLQSMPPGKMPQLLQIIRKRNDQLAQEGDEIELDIEALDTETLWELDRFVTNWKKFVSKTKRQALMVNSASAVPAPSVSADIDDVPMSEKIDGVKKNKKEAGEEDVDIGDEMPESSFPHVEIEKDDGGGGQGQDATGGIYTS